MSQGYKVAW